MGGIIKHTSLQLIPIWLQLNDVVARGGPDQGVNQERRGAEFFHDFVEDIFPMSYPSAQNLGRALEIARRNAPGQACWTSPPAPASGASRWRSYRRALPSPR